MKYRSDIVTKYCPLTIGKTYDLYVPNASDKSSYFNALIDDDGNLSNYSNVVFKTLFSPLEEYRNIQLDKVLE